MIRFTKNILIELKLPTLIKALYGGNETANEVVTSIFEGSGDRKELQSSPRFQEVQFLHNRSLSDFKIFQNNLDFDAVTSI